jgi:hypothetical protein
MNKKIKREVIVEVKRTAKWALKAMMTKEEYEDMKESTEGFCNAVDVVESGFFKGADITEPDNWDDECEFESEWDK